MWDWYVSSFMKYGCLSMIYMYNLPFCASSVELGSGLCKQLRSKEVGGSDLWVDWSVKGVELKSFLSSWARGSAKGEGLRCCGVDFCVFVWMGHKVLIWRCSAKWVGLFIYILLGELGMGFHLLGRVGRGITDGELCKVKWKWVIVFSSLDWFCVRTPYI